MVEIPDPKLACCRSLVCKSESGAELKALRKNLIALREYLRSIGLRRENGRWVVDANTTITTMEEHLY